MLQKSGFILCFREHNSLLLGKKKGNVDVDIVFAMMKSLIDTPEMQEKIILLSSDGDYKRVVEYLIKKEKFEKLIFPTKNPSSLYKKLGNKRVYYLGNAKSKIQYKKKGIVEHSHSSEPFRHNTPSNI